jgi:hypothetical protein
MSDLLDVNVGLRYPKTFNAHIYPKSLACFRAPEPTSSKDVLEQKHKQKHPPPKFEIIGAYGSRVFSYTPMGFAVVFPSV